MISGNSNSARPDTRGTTKTTTEKPSRAARDEKESGDAVILL